jgi:hypothetical protein
LRRLAIRITLGLVRPGSFYTTVAQVVPTLMVALAVELVAIRRVAEEIGQTLTEGEIQRLAAAGTPPFNASAITFFVGGLLT